MNQPVRHNGALGAFCPCATCYHEFGLLDDRPWPAPIPPPTPARVRDDRPGAINYLGEFGGQVPQRYVRAAHSADGTRLEHSASPSFLQSPRRWDRRKLVMWIGLGLLALGMAYLVGAPGGVR
jgi:hypothetical protein